MLRNGLERGMRIEHAHHREPCPIARSGDADAAIENFEKLLAQNPNYVAGYFQYGQLLARLSRTAEAKRTLTNGIEAARRSGDEHAGSEMEAALAQLPPS